MKPIFNSVDCCVMKVPSLDDGIDFYVNKLGLKLNWRTKTQAGLLMENSEAEVVLNTEVNQETEFLVDNAKAAFSRLVEAGAKVIREPFEIQVGTCAVVLDPWGNEIVIVDLSKGLLKTDENKNVVGNKPVTSMSRRRLNLVTLGVRDFRTSRDFYCKLFEWNPTNNSSDDIVFFDMGGYILGLFPWDKLAEDANIPPSGSGFSGITLAHNVREKSDVDVFLKRAESFGAKIIKPAQDVFWGGHSGYFSDPNGHLWEVAYNPYMPTKANGFLDVKD
jgi:uncharacterized protein